MSIFYVFLNTIPFSGPERSRKVAKVEVFMFVKYWHIRFVLKSGEVNFLLTSLQKIECETSTVTK